MTTKTELPPLWPRDVKLSIIGVTGKHESGKTGFLLSIDPLSTLHYDMELSSEFYEQWVKFERVCIPTILLKKFGKKKYTSRDVFETWYAHTKTVEKGQFRVIAVDPIDKIEAGLADVVKSRYNEFGFQSADNFTSMGGVFWNAVSVEYERIIMELQDKCEVFAYSNHLRKVWRRGKATDEVEPKGKGKLQELSTLRLFLDRSPARNGEDPPLIPSATVRKNRVSVLEVIDGEFGVPTTRMTPIVPPRIPECTADAIRKYIVTPPNFDNLKEEEKEVEKVLSSDERLELDAKIAEDKRIAAEAELEKTQQVAVMEARRQEAISRLRPRKDETEPAEEPEKVDAPTETGTDAGDQQPSLLTDDEVDVLSDLARNTGMYDRLKAGICKTLGVKVEDLTIDDVRTLPRAKYDEYIEFLRKV
jgi:hypothetical protein